MLKLNYISILKITPPHPNPPSQEMLIFFLYPDVIETCLHVASRCSVWYHPSQNFLFDDGNKPPLEIMKLMTDLFDRVITKSYIFDKIRLFTMTCV